MGFCLFVWFLFLFCLRVVSDEGLLVAQLCLIPFFITLLINNAVSSVTCCVSYTRHPASLAEPWVFVCLFVFNSKCLRCLHLGTKNQWAHLLKVLFKAALLPVACFASAKLCLEQLFKIPPVVSGNVNKITGLM